MKLEEVHITKGCLTDTIYICTINKRNPKLMNQKVDRTNEFWKAVLDMGLGFERIISDGEGNSYRIICEKVQDK